MAQCRVVKASGILVPLALGLLSAVLSTALATGAERPGDATPACLVLPFENTAEDPSLAWFSTGLALHTSEHLRGAGCTMVEDEERAVLLEGSGIPSGASLTLASSLELGRKMRARPNGVRPDRLILGRFIVQEGELTLSVRMIDLETERARPWIERKGRLKDLLEVHTSLVEALERDAGLKRAGKNHGKEPDAPLLAFESYSRAMAESDTRKRTALLRRAIQEFPGYPTASYQLAALLVKAERWDEAADTLGKSSADAHPYEAEFHLLSATVALQRKDPAAAVEEARRSLGFADSARGHAVLGQAQVALGDPESGKNELDKAVSLDPSQPEIEDLKKMLRQPAPAAGRAH